jgi:hypothetical protein
MHAVKRNAFIIVVCKPEGKRLIGRPRIGWLDDIAFDLRERERMGW